MSEIVANCGIPLPPRPWVVGTMGLTLRELYGIIAAEGEGDMIDKWAVEGELGLMMEAYSGEEIGRLKPEDIVKDVTSVRLLQTHFVTTLYRLYETREEIKLLRGRVEELQAENTSLRVIKTRYEEVRYKRYVDMILSVLLGFGMAESVRFPEEPMPQVVLIGTVVAILCSILYDFFHRKGGHI